MKKTFLSLLIAGISWLVACKGDGGPSERQVEEIPMDGKISSIIRSPITADGPVDTVNVAKITFESAEYDFGEVEEGAVVKHVFKFTNTGRAPLVIDNAHSTCGCTIPVWPKDPVPPGGQGEISVEFNTKSKVDFQEKPVSISANTYPSITQVYVRGFVRSTKK